MQHKERAHSKLSASGAERWTNCPGSVALSEGMPDKETQWAREGTRAHELVEQIMLSRMAPIKMGDFVLNITNYAREMSVPAEMARHAFDAAEFILNLGKELKAEVMVETRVYLDFIHPEMFGTFDGAVLDHFGTLHVFDFKYGAGHAVSPRENLQMIFYGLGLAHQHHWNFKKVRLWIIQPRIKGYSGPLFWDLSMGALKEWVPSFEMAARDTEHYPDKFNDGAWCHWCKGKSKCPLKQEVRLQKAEELFKNNPVQKGNGSHGEEKESKKESSVVTEAEWRKKAREKKRKGR